VIAEVRGIGLMLGLKCAVTNTDLVAKLREEGLLTVPAADNVVRLLPPLIIERDPCRGSGPTAIERACSRLRQGGLR
jgi:acetylornithine/N-succinyldiaminopimelate aminotransferase